MYLYLLRFEDVFKVGITNHPVKRIHKLASTYSEYKLNLEKSWIYSNRKTGVIAALETMIKEYMDSYRCPFMDKSKEGHTEFFYNVCFDETVEFLNYHVKFSSDSQKLSKQKGNEFIELPVRIRKLKVKEKLMEIVPEDRKFILNLLQKEKENFAVTLLKRTDDSYWNDNTYWGEIVFKSDFKSPNNEPFPFLIYREGSMGFKLFPSSIQVSNEKDLIKRIRFNIPPIAMNYPKAISFFEELFEVIGLTREKVGEIFSEYQENNVAF